MSPQSDTKPGSYSIIIVIISAVIGFMITLFVINNNIVQYSTLPPKISMKVRDGAKGEKDSAIFNLAVKSKLPIDDTVRQDTEIKSDKIERNILYHQNPSFPVWGMLILIMITIASGSFPVFTGQIIQLVKTFNLDWKQIAKASLFAFLIAVYLIVSNSSGKGYYHPPKIIDDLHILLTSGNILVGIVVASIFLMLPVIIVMFLIGPSSDKLFARKITKANAEKTANGLEQLNQVLRNTLQVLSVIVVFIVLTSSALRNSIKATVEIEGYDIFPAEVSYVYGMYFSLFLCIMYIPIYFYLKRQYNYLKAAVAEIGETEDKEEKILSSVDFKTSALHNIKMALTVLAPLLSSFLPENIHFLK